MNELQSLMSKLTGSKKTAVATKMMMVHGQQVEVEVHAEKGQREKVYGRLKGKQTHDAKLTQHMSLDDYIELAAQYVSAIDALEQRIAILAEANAGVPELVDGKAVYKVNPEEFAAAVEKIHSAGVNIIGGCCGTGPAHIEAVAKKIRKQ